MVLKTHKKIIRQTALFGAVCSLVILSSAHAEQNLQLNGLENYPDLHKYLKETVVDYFEDQETPPRRASVRARLEKALQAQGYYNADILYQDDSDAIYNITPGPLYRISSYDVLGYDEPPVLKIKAEDPLIAENVLKSQQNLLKDISYNTCFYQLSVKNRVFLDQDQHEAQIFYDVTKSDPATFGPTLFSGADKIKREYLYKFLKYKEGECWRALKLEDTKEALLQTGLISSIDTKLPDELPADGIVPIEMELKERAPHKVRLGTNYNTSEGPGVSAQWIHNNFFGAGEKVTVTGSASASLQKLGLDFDKPFFLSDKQNFQFSTALEHQDTDAYEEFGLTSSAAITRKMSKRWTGSLGVGLDLLQVTENGAKTENFALVSFPGSLNFDNRDNVLDPHKGYTLRLLASPVIDAIGTTAPFLKTSVTGTTYVALGKKLWDAVLAFRGSVGTIWGTTTNDIPASERFYAGGGGSIRGFGYQEAGPVDANNDPAGGRSLAETTAELRWKFTESFGAATFVDAGGVYDSAYPDFEGGTYISAGIGLRYYTDFGPVRFDIAVPMNKKDNLDQNYQIYISIGQAF